MKNLIQSLLKLRTKTALILLVFFAFFGHTQSYADGNPVQWGEIQSWRNLGPHWVGGLDESGNLLALYDLSYSNSQDPILLGTLDTSEANYNRIVAILTNARENIAANMAHQDSTSSLNHLQEIDETIQMAQDLRSNAYPVHSTSFENLNAPQWWKGVPWKSKNRKLSPLPPLRFFLSDISFEETPEILSRIQFIRNSQGIYEFHLNPSQSNAPNLPFKIADLRCLQCGFNDKNQKARVRASISDLVGKIQVPYLAGLVTTALNEYYQFEDELLFNHQQMLLEIVREAEENTSGSPFVADLSPSERELIIDSIFYSRTSLNDANQWASTTPMEEWKKQENNALTQASDSMSYLTQNSQTLTLLNPRFGLAKDLQSISRIYSLSADRYGNLLSPFIAYDYGKPTLNRDTRIAIETAHILVQFVDIFGSIPIVGSLVAKAFDSILEEPMQSLQHWESRLTAHLYTRSSTGENWEPQLDTLEQQEVNPMELSFAAQNQQAQMLKQQLHIP